MVTRDTVIPTKLSSGWLLTWPNSLYVSFGSTGPDLISGRGVARFSHLLVRCGKGRLPLWAEIARYTGYCREGFDTF